MTSFHAPLSQESLFSHLSLPACLSQTL